MGPAMEQGAEGRRLFAQMETELSKEGLAQNLVKVDAERLARGIRKRQPVVFTWTTDRSRDPQYFGLKPPEGSLTLYWASRTSGLINELQRAHASHDVAQLVTLHDRVVGEYRTRSVVSVAEAADSLCGAQVFFELRYAGRTLAQNLWLPDGYQFGSMVFPYNGSELQDNEFVIVEYYKDQVASPYDYTVVKSPPDLTEIERRTLAAVPPDVLEAKIAQTGIVAATPAAFVVATAVVTINTFTTTCCFAFHEKLSQITLPSALLQSMDPTASARELLRLRYQVFEEFGAR